MRLTELISLNELFGSSHGYGGEGNGIFQQRFYVYIANSLHSVDDMQAREFLTNWFVGMFKSDNARFKENLFREAVANGMRAGPAPQFQQRHFYYLAHHIKQMDDENIREFVADWLGKVIGRTNHDFLPMRWRKFCGLPMTPEQDKEVNRPRERRRY